MSHRRVTSRVPQTVQVQTSLNRTLLNQLAPGAVLDKTEVSAALAAIASAMDDVGATIVVPSSHVTAYIKAVQATAPNATAKTANAVKVKVFGTTVTFVPVVLN